MDDTIVTLLIRTLQEEDANVAAATEEADRHEAIVEQHRTRKSMLVGALRALGLSDLEIESKLEAEL